MYKPAHRYPARTCWSGVRFRWTTEHSSNSGGGVGARALRPRAAAQPCVAVQQQQPVVCHLRSPLCLFLSPSLPLLQRCLQQPGVGGPWVQFCVALCMPNIGHLVLASVFVFSSSAVVIGAACVVCDAISGQALSAVLAVTWTLSVTAGYSGTKERLCCSSEDPLTIVFWPCRTIGGPLPLQSASGRSHPKPTRDKIRFFRKRGLQCSAVSNSCPAVTLATHLWISDVHKSVFCLHKSTYIAFNDDFPFFFSHFWKHN